MNAEQNTTVSLPQLIQALSEISGADAATSRKFLHEFFAMIEDTLVQGHSVKIKGIGTFAVDDRENGSVRFTPDAELAAAVNTPFAMFEPIELADGMTADDLADEEEAPEQVTETEVEVPQDDEPLIIIDEAEPAREPEAAEEEAEEPEEEPEVPEEEAEVPETETEVTEEEPEVPEEEPEIAEEEIAEEEIAGEEEEDEEQKAGGGSMLRYAATAVVALAVGFGAGYFCRDAIGGDAQQVALVPADTVAAVVAPVDSAVAVVSEPADTVVEAAPFAVPAPVEVTDTIRRNHFLASMARHHYGRMEYWVYIYEANPGLGHPDRIKPGTVVRIPDRSSFALQSDSATLEHALKLYAEIYSRYK